MRAVAAPTRAEPPCLAYDALRAVDDDRCFFVQSRWTNEAAFDLHAALPHTVAFVAAMDALADEPARFARMAPIA